MKLRTSTLDLIATEYAEAVAIGAFERAEGWLAVAEFAAARRRDGSGRDRRRLPRLLEVTRERSRSRTG